MPRIVGTWVGDNFVHLGEVYMSIRDSTRVFKLTNGRECIRTEMKETEVRKLLLLYIKKNVPWPHSTTKAEKLILQLSKGKQVC